MIKKNSFLEKLRQYLQYFKMTQTYLFLVFWEGMKLHADCLNDTGEKPIVTWTETQKASARDH